MRRDLQAYLVPIVSWLLTTAARFVNLTNYNKAISLSDKQCITFSPTYLRSLQRIALINYCYLVEGCYGPNSTI